MRTLCSAGTFRTGADEWKEGAGREHCGPGAPPFCLLAPLIFFFLSVSAKRLPITQSVFIK